MQTLKKGSIGDTVRYMQSRLRELGYDVGARDGVFGERTLEAVEQFQMAHSLEVDGIVGTMTWSMLTAGVQVPPDVNQRAKRELLKMVEWTGAHDGEEFGVEAVKHAIAYLGCKETPNGSNKGKEIASLVDGYNGHWGIRGDKGHPWCAMAVSSWIGMAVNAGTRSTSMDWNNHPFGRFFGGCTQIERWAAKMNVWYPVDAGADVPEIRCGSIFTMGRGGSGSDVSKSVRAGHTGLVVAVHDDGTITTIEGNTSNKVKSLTRRISSLRGFVSWWKVL